MYPKIQMPETSITCEKKIPGVEHPDRSLDILLCLGVETCPFSQGEAGHSFDLLFFVSCTLIRSWNFF